MSVAEIQKIIREAEKLTRSPDANINFKPLPDNWCDFVKLISIQSGDRIVKYIPYQYQIDLDKTLETHHTVIGVKSRQMGWTTYAASKGLHKALKNPAYTAIYISRTQADASLIAYTARQMLKSLGDYGVAENDNLLILRIKNGGTLHFRSPGENATRGIPSVSDIFIDEAAFIDGIDLLYGQIKNTQSMVENARTLIISTPNTVTDWFYQRLTTGTPEILEEINQVRLGEKKPVQILIDNKTGWAKFICHWKAHPIYSLNSNYLQECADQRQIPLEMVYREQDLSFEDNVENAFSLKLIQSIFTLEKTEEINTEAEYYFGIDTNAGGKDYFVCAILKVCNGQINLIDLYRNRTNTAPVNIERVSQLINKYNPYRVSIETNAGGRTYYDLFKEAFPSLDLKEIYTSESSKPNMISRLLYLMENNDFYGLNTQIVKDEFLSYQKIGNKYGAISGKHDDVVMAVAVGCCGVKFYK